MINDDRRRHDVGKVSERRAEGLDDVLESRQENGERCECGVTRRLGLANVKTRSRSANERANVTGQNDVAILSLCE